MNTLRLVCCCALFAASSAAAQAVPPVAPSQVSTTPVETQPEPAPAPAPAPVAQPAPAPVAQPAPAPVAQPAPAPVAPPVPTSAPIAQPAPAVAPAAPPPPAAAPIAPPAPVYPTTPVVAEPSAPLPVAGVDASTYRRNRVVAGLGKGLTVLAPILFIAVLASVVEDLDADSVDDDDSQEALMAAWFFGGTAGRLMWAGADLRMTNLLNRSGVLTRRGAAITSMVTAGLSIVPYLNIAAVPATWIAGSVASANIRDSQRAMGVGQLGATAPTLRPQGFSAGVTLHF